MDKIHWLSDNEIRVSKARTTLVCFRNPRKRVEFGESIVLHGSLCTGCQCSPIPFYPTVRYFGIDFDENMSWCDHVEHVVKRLRPLTEKLYRIKHNSSIQLRKTVFEAMDESILRYGIGLCMILVLATS